MSRLTIFAVFVALALVAGTAYARPVAVTMYPDSARVVEREILSPVLDGSRASVTVVLPVSADPASLRLAFAKAGGLRVADMSPSKVKRLDEARVALLRKRLETLLGERAAIGDEMSARKDVAAFWTSRAASKSASALEAREMAEAMRQGLGSELTALSILKREAADKDKQVKLAREELDRATGGAETVWEVDVELAGDVPDQVEATFIYTQHRCGWRPLYTLEALPDQGRVDFEFRAGIWQNTGREWSGVALTLATAAFTGGTRPPEVRPWIIEKREIPRETFRKAAPAMAGAMDMQSDMLAEAVPPVAQKRLFDEYDAGIADLPSGGKKTISLRRKAWKTTFDYLVRPQFASRAFLRARPELAAAPKLPPGKATFLLDGAVVRTASFTLSEKEVELYFGADPQLAVKVVTKDKKEGQAGFISKDTTHDWDWLVEITNNKSMAVKVRVEDAAPQPRHEKIEIKARTAKADTKDHVTAWDLDIQPGKKASLEYGYTVSYPREMDIDIGR